MNNIFPPEVAAVFRANFDTLVEKIGQECKLYKTVSTAKDILGDAVTTEDDSAIHTHVLVQWSPEMRRLKELGLYVDAPNSSVPILAYFKFDDDPQIDDYVELEFEYSIGDVKTNKFEVVDRKLRGHGAEARSIWVIAPKRS